MSDQIPETAPSAAPAAANPAVANAAAALAVKELGETVTGLRKSVKTLWITVIVVAVLAVGSLVMNFVPGLRFGLAGRPNFQRGQFNGTFQGAPSGQGGNTGTTNQ